MRQLVNQHARDVRWRRHLQKERRQRDCAKALGHSDSRITRKHYAQYLPNEVAEGVRKMAPFGAIESASVERLKLRR